MDRFGNKISEGDWIFDGEEYYKIVSIKSRSFNRIYAKFVSLDGHPYDTYLLFKEMVLISPEQSLMLELSR